MNQATLQKAENGYIVHDQEGTHVFKGFESMETHLREILGEQLPEPAKPVKTAEVIEFIPPWVDRDGLD